MLFFVTDWIHTFKFKKSELFLDFLIIFSFFFFFFSTVRNPVKDTLVKIDRWAFVGAFLSILLVVYIFIRSYVYYFWTIRGYPANFLHPNLYNGRKIGIGRELNEDDFIFKKFNLYRRFPRRWRRASFMQKNRYWVRNLLIRRRIHGGYQLPLKRLVIPLYRKRYFAWIERRRTKRKKFRRLWYKRRMRRRYRRHKKRSVWTNK